LTSGGSHQEDVMAKALVLWPVRAGIRIGSSEATQLAALGVTNVTLLRDAETIAIVLEGWAFDTSRSVLAAAAALGDATTCRVLEPALDVAVSNTDTIGGFDAPTLARDLGDLGSGEPVGR
jgi:hypothetical protein